MAGGIAGTGAWHVITCWNAGTAATNGRRGWPLHNLGVKVSEVVRGQRRDIVAPSTVITFAINMEIMRAAVRIGVTVVSVSYTHLTLPTKCR